MIELNISCPNVDSGGLSFGTDPDIAAALTREVKKFCGGKPLVVKLSPNVTDITQIALAVESAGADAVSMINTLQGMRINVRTGKPILAKGSGGLSGPAIHPVAVHMVYSCSKVLSIPIIAMGGVSTADDALEFFYAGAEAVAIGTAALVDPEAPVKILRELEEKIAGKK
jgi:dihydroorotate dehydrogenase (NAD+) catalytic subunit